MASKGPKSVPPKGIAKPIDSTPPLPAAVTEAPPVPFVAQPAPKSVSKPATPRAPTAKPAPVPLAPVESTESVPAPVPAQVPVVSVSPAQTPTPAIAPATAVMQKDFSTMDATATINTAADTAQAEAKTVFADVNDRAKTAMEKGSKMIADLNEFSKGNLEAVVESSKIAAKGAEDIARYTSDYVRTTVEKANATASQFASIKSPTEFFKLQSELTKQAIDSMMAETAKFTEGYVKLLGEIAQPISNRVAVAVEKVKVAA